jgi:hypothetical protein
MKSWIRIRIETTADPQHYKNVYLLLSRGSNSIGQERPWQQINDQRARNQMDNLVLGGAVSRGVLLHGGGVWRGARHLAVSHLRQGTYAPGVKGTVSSDEYFLTHMNLTQYGTFCNMRKLVFEFVACLFI